MQAPRVSLLTVLSTLALAVSSPGQAHAGAALTLKASFEGSDGQIPFSSLTPGGDGFFYGTTFSGGGSGLGSIYAFDPALGTITRRASFTGTNGASPWSGLTPAGDGSFLGTTTAGGSNGFGGIYAFDPLSGAITLRVSFTGSNGAQPWAGLKGAGDSTFLGTTLSGGANERGAVYGFDPATNSLTLRASFSNSDGLAPYAELTAGGDGLFYGTTSGGGASGEGAVYAFDPGTDTITLRASFDGSNGSSPRAALTPGGDGLLYGTTTTGGANDQGGIYAFDPDSGTLTLRASFDGSNGSIPYAGLTALGGGRFYGTTRSGGDNGLGAVYLFDAANNSITLQASFNGADGTFPNAALTPAGGGLYYGTTVVGGASDKGAVFAFGSGTAVPGPLPLAGAGMALAWSRRLRRRMAVPQRRRAAPQRTRISRPCTD